MSGLEGIDPPFEAAGLAADHPSIPEHAREQRAALVGDDQLGSEFLRVTPRHRRELVLDPAEEHRHRLGRDRVRPTEALSVLRAQRAERTPVLGELFALLRHSRDENLQPTFGTAVSSLQRGRRGLDGSEVCVDHRSDDVVHRLEVVVHVSGRNTRNLGDLREGGAFDSVAVHEV